MWVKQASCSGAVELSIWGYFKQATVLACSPSSLSAAVGTMGGSVHFLDVRDAEAPQAIHRAFPSEWSVQHLL